jgi:hypothetical protein
MHHIFMMLLLTTVLAGCAQPPAEKPLVKGAYLVIDGSEAWAVLVDGSQRREEHGTVIGRALSEGVQNASAAYLIKTSNCGELQWVSPRSASGAISAEARLFLPVGSTDLEKPECIISDAKNVAWTALDYSS